MEMVLKYAKLLLLNIYNNLTKSLFQAHDPYKDFSEK